MVTNDLGDVLRLTGDLAKAELYYRRALSLLEVLGLSQDEICRVNLGLVLIERGRYREARPLLEQALVGFERQERRALRGAAHACLLPALAADRDWLAWDGHLARAAQLLEETGMVDVDIARMAEVAGDIAHAHAEPARAREAWTLALVQWRALQRAADAARVLSRLDGVGSRDTTVQSKKEA